MLTVPLKVIFQDQNEDFHLLNALYSMLKLSNIVVFSFPSLNFISFS